MDSSYPYAVPPTVAMGSLISTILQLKSQVDFMDQFLLLYVPEYVQLKNYVIQTQQNGMGSNVPTTIFPGSTSVQPSANEAVPSNFASPSSTVNSFMRDQALVYSTRNGINNTIPHAKSNVRRKQPLVKKSPVVPSFASSQPTTIKRRGRKRKYPIAIPNENTGYPGNNYQNIQQVSQNAEGIIKIYVPVVSAPPSQNISESDVGGPSNTTNPSACVNGTKRMSSLDVLAAVSYVLKQKGVNKSPMPVYQEASSNSNPTVSVDANNVDQQQQSSSEHNVNPLNSQGCHESPSSARNDEHLKNNCGEREDFGKELSLPSLSAEYQHYQTTSDQFLSTHSSSSAVSHSIIQSQEEYSVITGRSPVQELIV